MLPGQPRLAHGRIGAGGVYLFFGQGYPTFKTLALWKVDTAKPQIVLKVRSQRARERRGRARRAALAHVGAERDDLRGAHEPVGDRSAG